MHAQTFPPRSKPPCRQRRAPPPPPCWPCRWEGLFADFEDFVASEQAASEDSGRDPGIGALLSRFIADEELTGLDRLALL